MNKNESRDSILSIASQRLGLDKKEINATTKLGEQAEAICTLIVARLGKTIACDDAKNMTVGKIFRQLDL